jgi:hypothetical protein
MNSFDAFVYKFPFALVFLFLLMLYQVLFQNPTVFLKKHGRKHAITGLFYLIWISYGFISLFRSKSVETQIENSSLPQNASVTSYFMYDVVLGVLGTVLTVSAAYEFQHKNVKNVASGTLDEHATVTFNEMIEHAFYQLLNLFQAMYLHLMVIVTDQFLQQKAQNGGVPPPLSYYYSTIHVGLLVFVTSLWTIRSYFPVNKFSDNYTKVDAKSTSFIRLLYHIKKYQYIFYKHFILHGLNIAVAYRYHQMIHSSSSENYNGIVNGKLDTLDNPTTFLPSSVNVDLITFLNTKYFHIFWLCLNLSYVMEFFLQTLVKKSYLKQQRMLFLQQVLMLASSVVAIHLLRYIPVLISIMSMIGNFLHRKYDFLNTMIIFALCLIYFHFLSNWSFWRVIFVDDF